MAELITAADFGTNTSTDHGLFDWLLASLLFGRPVPQKAAASAFQKFKADGWDSDRLQRFKGVGPKTAEIFLREVPHALIGTE